MGRHFIKSFIIIKLLLIGVVITVFAIYGIMFMYSAPQKLGSSLTNLAGVNVSIKDMHFRKGSFSIEGISMDNPRGYSIKQAFSAKSVVFKTPYYEYIKPNIIIDEIQIEDLEIAIEFSNPGNTVGNWTDIMKYIEKELHKEKSAQVKNIHGRVVLIKKIVLTNTKIILKQFDKNPIHADPIPHLVLTNIDSEKGVPMNLITQIVIKQVVKTLSASLGIQDMLISIITIPAQLIKLVFEPFSLLFGASNPPEQEQGN